MSRDRRSESAARAAEAPAPLPRGWDGPVRWAGTFLGAGRLPLFPGTWATAASGGLYAALWALGAARPAVVLGLGLFFLAAGLALARPAERSWGRKDPGFFVLDECAGYFLTLAFFDAYTIPLGLGAFLAFRFFDIVKLPPAAQLESVGGGAGIMLDDVAAAVYANLTLRLALSIVG